MLHPAKDLPVRKYGKRPKGESYVAHDVREFARSGMRAAKLAYEGKRGPTVYATVRKYLKENPSMDGVVGVCLRGGETYLYKREGV